MDKISVSEKDVGRRLDEFLFEQGIAPSRSKVQTLIKEKQVFVK